MIHPDHPICFIKTFLDQQQRVQDVFLGIFRYHPQSLIDDRVNHRVRVEKLQHKYDALANHLQKDEEIAFHSLVTTTDRKLNNERHIPLVDFKSRIRPRVEEAADLLINEYAVERAALFASGRSFHLYLGKLMRQDAWVKFMGRLLLLNTPRGHMLTDSRWIGHRLMAGYGALRWSANLEPYLKMGPPKLIRQW